MARYINKYETLADYEDASSEAISTDYDVANVSLISNTHAKKYDHKIMLGRGSVLESLNRTGSDGFNSNTWLVDTDIASSNKLKEHKGFGTHLLQSVTNVDNVLSEMNASEIMHYEYKASDLVSITIPEGVTHVYTGAFCGCANLVEVKLPSTLVYIGKRAFKNCTSLTSIVIPANVTKIDTSAFAYCTSLEEVIFENGSRLANLHNNVFRRCRSLESISLPDGVVSLNRNVFRECDSLNYLRIGSGLRFVSPGAFRGCFSLERIDVSPNNTRFRVENGVTIMTTFNNGDPMDRVVHVNTSLTEVVIPPVISIQFNVLRNCLNLTNIVCNGLKAIFKRTFAGCESLESATIRVTAFNNMQNAFINCPNLTDLTLIPGEHYNDNGDFADEFVRALSDDSERSAFGTYNGQGYQLDHDDAIANIDLHVPSEYVQDFENIGFNSVTSI